MNHKRNKQCDKCRIAKVSVSFLYHSHQTELCDRKSEEGKDGGENGIAEQMAVGTLCLALIPLDRVDTAGYDTGDHVDGGGNCSEDDQDRDDRCQNLCADAVLYEDEHRNGSAGQISHIGDAEQSDNRKLHCKEVAQEHADGGAVDLFYIGNILHMLVHNRNGSQLEEEVQHGRVKRRSESAGFMGEHGHFAGTHASNDSGDIAPLCDDIRNKNDNKADDDQNAKRRSTFPHNTRAEEGNEENESGDDHGAQPVRHTGQGLNRGTAGCESGCGSRADHNQVADFIEVRHHRAGFAIQSVRKATVIVRFVFVGKTHAVPEEQRVESLRQCRKDQAPDAVVDEILVNLCAGGKTAAELCGKCNESEAHGKRHAVFAGCFGITHNYSPIHQRILRGSAPQTLVFTY